MSSAITTTTAPVTTRATRSSRMKGHSLADRRSRTLKPVRPSKTTNFPDRGESRGWIIYARVSSDEQTKGTSLKNQQEICRSWLIAQGYPLYRVIQDGGASGGNLRRTGMDELLTEIERGTVQGVLTSKLDRLSRDLPDTMALVEEFKLKGVRFTCVQDPVDTSTAAGMAFFQIVSVFAQLERGIISERQISSIRHRRAQNLFTGGRVPVGMRSIGPKGGRKLEVDPVLGPLVAKSWQKVIEGASIRDVAAYLTDARVPTRHGGPWTITSVWGLLRRPGIRGTLIEPNLFDRVQYKLGARWSPTKAKCGQRPPEEHSSPNGVTERIWPLQGIARCAYCGCALVGTHGNGKGGRYYYLTCNGQQRRGRNTCEAKLLPAERWERGAIRALSWIADQPDEMALHLAMPGNVKPVLLRHGIGAMP